MEPATPDDAGETAPDRLNSWKEIAGHLGCSVRTVQRWETEFGLPVHRRRGGRGELVYAFRGEIDRWERGLSRQQLSMPRAVTAGARPEGQDPPPLRPPGVATRWRWPLAVTLTALALAALPVAFVLLRTGELETVRFDASKATLTGFDTAGDVLWQQAVGFAFDPRVYDPRAPGTTGRSLVVKDIDADGRKETLFLARAIEEPDTALHCLNSDGTTRFRFRPPRRVTCGNDVFGPPFWVSQFKVGAQGPRHDIWVVSLHRDFPAVVSKLTPSGDLVGEFWMNGHVRVLEEIRVEGRSWILVGGTSNDPDDRGTAALAVIDPQHPWGAVPAIQSKFACRGSSEGWPEVFLKLPRLDTLVLHAYVTQFYPRPDSRLDVIVSQHDGPAPGEPASAVRYVLDKDFNVVGAVLEDDFISAHARQAAAGRLDHPCGSAEEEGMWNVQRWRQGRPTTVGRPPR